MEPVASAASVSEMTSDQAIRTRASAPRALRGSPDPRVVLFGFLSVAAWLTTTPSALATAIWIGSLLSTGAVVRWGRGGLRADLSRLRWGSIMALTVAVLYLLFMRGSGEPLAALGFMTIREDVLRTAIHLALRLVGFILLAGLLTDLISPSGMAAAITRVLLPLRRIGARVEGVYHLVYFTTRMLPLLIEEVRTIRVGQMSRGIRFDGSLRRRVSASLSLVIPAFASAIRRSERLSLALATRGFDPTKVPAAVADLRLSANDLLFLGLLSGGWVVWVQSRFGVLSRLVSWG